MAIRINSNLAAINAHRNLQNNDAKLGKSLESLSSGLKINRASDGPAALMISEQMRSQIAGTHQAINNSETAVSMVQTTEANMGEVARLLIDMRQLALHASNEGVNDIFALQADQTEIVNALSTVNRIAERAQFGGRKLLDGSNGVSGNTTGDNLEFVNANEATSDSRENGFEVKVSQLSTKAKLQGTTVLTQEMIEAGEELSVFEDGKLATYVSNKDDTIGTTLQNLQNEINRQGIKVDVEQDDSGQILLVHRKYGSDYSFQAYSSTAGVTSATADELQIADKGMDIKGTINGESTFGKGQILTGIDGSKCIEGLQIKYSGEDEDLTRMDCFVNDKLGEEAAEEPQIDELPEEGKTVGRVYITQNSIRFQVGGGQDQTVGVSIRGLKTDFLAKNIANKSGFKNLADIDLLTYQGAQDSLKLIDSAIAQVSEDRGTLGAFQKNTLEYNLTNLRVANENLISSESIIRDVDMASEMAEYTKNGIKSNAAAVMLAQANQEPEKVRALLG